jgi:hypothetical protein
MPEASVTYIFPSWGLIPTKEMMAKKYAGVHVQVAFAEDSTLPVEIVHNLGLPYGAPLQPPEWVPPFVVVNPISGGANAPLHTVTVLNGDTCSIGRVAGGPGSAVTFDVWILRPAGKSGAFGWL